MTESVFIDTGAFFAIKSESDKNHPAALGFFNFALEKNIPFSFVTTDFIIFETVTLIKTRMDAPTAIEAGKQLRSNDHIKIVKISEDIISRAWDIFDKYDDKDYSFVDCTSFAVMKELGIRKAFAFDRHFAQFGFDLIP